MKILRNGLLVLLVLLAAPSYSHTDLELQIAEISRQLEQQADNVELLLRRGDLQRRHANRALALADFRRVREIEPGNSRVDWFEGRLQIETGRPEEGVGLLNRFLLANPGHLIAMQNRAQGYLLLGRPLQAAEDYVTVIQASDYASPSLYKAAATAFIKAGEDHYPDAMDVIRQGLQRFPAEISLTAIGTDLALASQDSETAFSLIDRLPVPVQRLYQWQLRQALLNCQLARPTEAEQWFSNASRTQSNPDNQAALLTRDRLAELAAEPSVRNCREAAEEMLKKQ